MPTSTGARGPADMGSPVLLPQPVLHGLAAAFFATLAVVGILALFLGSYSRKETVKGEVVASAGFTAVATEKPGTLVSLHVRLGERVVAGQLLAEVRIPRIVAGSGDTAELTIARLKRMQVNLNDRSRRLEAALASGPGLIGRVNTNADRSIRAAAATRASVGRQSELANERLLAARSLADRGFASRTVLAQVENAVHQTDQARAGAELAQSEIERARTDRILSINTEMRSLEQALLDVQNQRIQVDTQIHDLQALEFVRVVAPADGEVRAVAVRPGQRLEAGDRLLALARPGSSLTVALEVPSTAIGFIEPGQRVVLKYDAYPFQSFGVRYGRVATVQSAALGRAPDPTDPTAPAGGRFVVEVRPDEQFVDAYGARRPLRIGMSVTAEVTLERQRLVRWLLEPIYSMRGALG